MRPQARRPLDGVRIVDLSGGIAGGYATKLLADAGAEIVSIEPPEGDPLRRRGVTDASFDADGDGLLFRYLRTNQRALVLDLESEAGRSALHHLYRECDAVLDSLSAVFLEGHDRDARGIGERALARLNPAASWLSTSRSSGVWKRRTEMLRSPLLTASTTEARSSSESPARTRLVRSMIVGPNSREITS